MKIKCCFMGLIMGLVLIGYAGSKERPLPPFNIDDLTITIGEKKELRDINLPRPLIRDLDSNVRLSDWQEAHDQTRKDIVTFNAFIERIASATQRENYLRMIGYPSDTPQTPLEYEICHRVIERARYIFNPPLPIKIIPDSYCYDNELDTYIATSWSPPIDPGCIFDWNYGIFQKELTFNPAPRQARDSAHLVRYHRYEVQGLEVFRSAGETRDSIQMAFDTMNNNGIIYIPERSYTFKFNRGQLSEIKTSYSNSKNSCKTFTFKLKNGKVESCSTRYWMRISCGGSASKE